MTLRRKAHRSNAHIEDLLRKICGRLGAVVRAESVHPTSRSPTYGVNHSSRRYPPFGLEVRAVAR